MANDTELSKIRGPFRVYPKREEKEPISTMDEYHKEFIKHYGEDNKLRLTGEYETQHIDKFSYGVSDRGASIRIPLGVAIDDYKGYLEDRRPAANADPYKLIDLVSNLLKIKETHEVL